MSFRKISIALIPLILLLAGCASPEIGRVKQMEDEWSSEAKNLPELGEEARLSDYLKYAALNNPGLRSAFSKWKAEVEQVAVARSLPDPRFSYAYFIEEVETRVGPQRQKFELSQMFPWFGKLSLRGDISEQAAKAAYQRYEQARLRLFYRVSKSYYEYYYLSRAISITERNVGLMADLESVALASYKAGSTGHSSVIRAQVELGRLQDRLKSLKELRGPVAAQLNAVMNRPVDTPIQWPRSLPASVDVPDGIDLIGKLETSSPEIKELELLVNRQKARARLARKAYFPDIMLGAALIETGDAAMDVEDSGKDAVMGMIGISLPLWYGKTKAETASADAELNAAKLKYDDRRNTLKADIMMAYYNLQDANRKIDLYENGLIPKARESLKVNKQAFETGKADFLDVIDSERVLIEFELSFERARADRACRLAELEMLTGRKIGTKTQNRGD